MTKKRITDKHFRLNVAKLRLAKKLLHVETDKETIEWALDAVVAEHERDRLACKANERFVASRINIRDVYGKLGS